MRLGIFLVTFGIIVLVGCSLGIYSVDEMAMYSWVIFASGCVVGAGILRLMFEAFDNAIK